MKAINKYIFGSMATAVSATNAKEIIKIKNLKDHKTKKQYNKIFKNSIEKQNIADLIHKHMQKTFVNEKKRRNLYLKQVFTKNTARQIIDNSKMQEYLSSFYENNNDIKSLIDKNFINPDFQENLYKAFVDVTKIDLNKVYMERWVHSHYVKSGMTINFNKLKYFISQSSNEYFSPFDLTFQMKKYDKALRKHNFKYKELVKNSFQANLFIENVQKSITKSIHSSQYSFQNQNQKNKILSKVYLMEKFIDLYWENKSDFSYVSEYTNEKDLEKLENITLINQIENFSLKILEKFKVQEKNINHSLIINKINNKNIIKKSSISKKINEININDFNNNILINYGSEDIEIKIEHNNLTKVSDTQILLSINISFDWKGKPYTFRDIKLYPTFKKADIIKSLELSGTEPKKNTNLLLENTLNKNYEFDQTVEWHLKKRAQYIDLATEVRPIDYTFSHKDWNIKLEKWIPDNEKKQVNLEFQAINSLDSKNKKNLKYKLKGFISEKEKIANYIKSFLSRIKWFHPTLKSKIPSKIRKLKNQISNGLNIEISNWIADDINGEISFDAKASKVLGQENLYIVKRIVVSNFNKQTKLKESVNPATNYFELIKETFSDFDIDRLMTLKVKDKNTTRKYKIIKRKWEEVSPFEHNHWLLDNNKEYESRIHNLDYSKFLDEKNKINIQTFNDWYQNIYLNKAGNFDWLAQKEADISSIKNLPEKLKSIKEQYIIYMQAYMLLAPFFDYDVFYDNKKYNLMNFLFKNIEEINMLKPMKTIDGQMKVNSQVFAYQFIKFIINKGLLKQNDIKNHYIFSLTRFQGIIRDFFWKNINYDFQDKVSKFITFDTSGMSQEKINLFLEKRKIYTASRRSFGTLIALIIEESTDNELDSNEWFEQASKVKIEYFHDQELENILQDPKIRAINPGIEDFMLNMKLKTKKIMHLLSSSHDLLGLLLIPKLTPDNTSNIKIALTPYMAIITDGSNVAKKLRGNNYLKQIVELNINMIKSFAKTVPGFARGMAHDILETKNYYVGQITRYWDEGVFTNNEENKTYLSINSRLKSYAWDNKIIRGNIKLNNNESRWIPIPDRLGGFKDNVKTDPKDIAWLKSLIEQSAGKFYLVNRSFGIIPGSNTYSNSIDNLGLKREIKLYDIFENINNKSEYDFEVEKLLNFNEFLDFYTKISNYLLDNQPPYYGADIDSIKKYLKNLVQLKNDKVVINKFETDNIKNIKRALKYATDSEDFNETFKKSLPVEIKTEWDTFIDNINQHHKLQIIFDKIQDKLMSPNLPLMLSIDYHSNKSSDFSRVEINDNDCSMFNTVFNIWEKAYNYAGFSRRNSVVKNKQTDKLIQHMNTYFGQDFKSIIDFNSGSDWALSECIIQIMQAYNKNLRFFVHRSDLLRFFTYSTRSWWKNPISITGGITGGPWVESVIYNENPIFHEFGHYMDYNRLYGRATPYILDHKPTYELDGQELMRNLIFTKSIPGMNDKSYLYTLAQESFSSGKNQVELKINGKVIDPKFYKGDEELLTIYFSKDSKIKKGDLIEITFTPFNGKHGVSIFTQIVTEAKKDFYKEESKMDYQAEVFSEFMERFGPIPSLTKKPINSQEDVFPKNSSSKELINYFNHADELRTSPERLENPFSWWETYGSYYRNKVFLDIKIFDYLRKNNLQELRRRIGRFTMPSGSFVSIKNSKFDDDWKLLKTKAIKNQNGYIDLKDAIKFLSDNAYVINLKLINSFPEVDHHYSIFGFTPITGGNYQNHQVLSLKLILAIFGWDGVQRILSNRNNDKTFSTIRENILNNKYSDIFGSQKDVVLSDLLSNKNLLNRIDINDYFAKIIENGELLVPTKEINGVKITDLKSMHSWFYQVVLQNSQESNVYALESKKLDELINNKLAKGNFSEFKRFFMWLWQVHTSDYRNNGELWNNKNPSDLPINYNYYDRKYNLSKNLNIEANYEKPRGSIIKKLLVSSESLIHPIVRWYIKIWNYRNSGIKNGVNYEKFLKFHPDFSFKILDQRETLKEIISKISGFKNSIESFPEKIKHIYNNFELMSKNNWMKIIDKLILEKDSFSDFLDSLSTSEDDIQKGINKIIDQIAYAASDSLKHHDVSSFIDNLEKNRKEMIIFQQESFELRKIVQYLLDTKSINIDKFSKINKEINDFSNSKTKDIFPLFNLLISAINNSELNSVEQKEISDFSRKLNVLSSFNIDAVENFKFKRRVSWHKKWHLISNNQKLKNLSLEIINNLLKNIIRGNDIDFVIESLNEKISEFVVLKTIMLNSILIFDGKIDYTIIKKEDIDSIYTLSYNKVENKMNFAYSEKLNVHESLQPIWNWYKNYWTSLNHSSLDFVETHKKIVHKLSDFENGFILLMNIITGAGQHGYWKLLNEKPIWTNKENHYEITLLLKRGIKNLESQTAEISDKFSKLKSTDIEKARRIIKQLARRFVDNLYKRPQKYKNTMDPLRENREKTSWGGRLFVLETDASLIPKNQEYLSKFSDVSILFKSMFEKGIYSQDEYNEIIFELNSIYLSANKKFDKLIIAVLKPLSSDIGFDSNKDISLLIKYLNKINEIEYNDSKIKYELNYVSTRNKDFSSWSDGRVAPISIIGSKNTFYSINIFDYTANMIAVENYTFQKSLELLQDIILQSENTYNENSLNNLNNSIRKISSFISWDINKYGEEKYDEKQNEKINFSSILEKINKFSKINKVRVFAKTNALNIDSENIDATYSVIVENYELEKEISKSMQKIINQYSIQKINKLQISENKKNIEVFKLKNTIYKSLINMFENNKKNYYKLRIPQKIHEQFFALCLIFDISLSEILKNDTDFSEKFRQLIIQDSQIDLYTKEDIIIANKDYYGVWLVDLIAENIDNIYWDSFENKVIFINSLIGFEEEMPKVKNLINLISWKNNKKTIGLYNTSNFSTISLDSLNKNTNLFIDKINDISRILKMDDNQKGILFKNIFNSLYSGTNIQCVNWVKENLNIDFPYSLIKNTSNWEFLNNFFQIIFNYIQNKKMLSLVNASSQEIEKIYN